MTSSDYLISGNHNIPIAVISLQQFMGKLPVEFYKGENEKIHHDPNRINLFLDKEDKKLFANAYRKVVKVDTDEAFAVMKQRLLSLPIFLNVLLKEQYTEDYVVVQKTVANGMHVVAYINPTHPVIKAQLQKQFDECEQLIGKGKKFSFEIRVGEVLKSWYASYSTQHMFASYDSNGSTICVTNFRQRCNFCYHSLAWCIPVTWVLGPPYLIYRAITCNDIISELNGFVTLIGEEPQIFVQQTNNQQTLPQPLQHNVHVSLQYSGHPQPTFNAGIEMRPLNHSQFNNPATTQMPISQNPYPAQPESTTKEDAL